MYKRRVTMGADRTAIVDRIVANGCSRTLYCNVYDALVRLKCDVSSLVNPDTEHYKLRFGIENNVTFDPCATLLATIFETFPIEVLECVANILEAPYPCDFDSDCDENSDDHWDTGYDSC